ncbi:MAG: SDR family oxidoreductase [Vicingaceae bacterium]
MNTLILGASGLIGSNLLREIKGTVNWNVTGTYFSYPAKDTLKYNTLDLNDKENLDITKIEPEVIVHCGALTWVDYCEKNTDESFQKTVQSTINAVKIAEKYKSKFVYLSTDYIFNGENGPYREDDIADPISVYGRHKWEAEQVVLNSLVDSIICRVTNVYGNEERGKNFVSRLIGLALSRKIEDISLPIDQFATPVNAADVAKGIIHLLRDNKTGIYNLASTDYMNRYQLATRVLKYFPENSLNLVPVLTPDLNQVAKRPLLGGLISEKFLKEYPTYEFGNTDDYINDFIRKQQTT